MGAIFTGAETWRGGFYELAPEYPSHVEELLDVALKAVWDAPGLEGCYLHAEIEPSEQDRVVPSLTLLVSVGHLRGIATLPNGKRVACGTFLVRKEGGSDWLGLYLPLGALAAAYDVKGYPFDNGASSQQWREPLANWLANIGRFVFSRAPFALGLVGFEVSGTVHAAELSLSEVENQRPIGYLYPTEDKLTWYPTNQWHQQPHLAS